MGERLGTVRAGSRRRHNGLLAQREMRRLRWPVRDHDLNKMQVISVTRYQVWSRRVKQGASVDARRPTDGACFASTMRFTGSGR